MTAIRIEDPSPLELKSALEAELGAAEIDLQVESTRFTGLEAPVLIAGLSAAGSALTALITGLLSVWSSHRQQSIVIKGTNGEVQVPIGTKPEEVERYVNLARSLSPHTITRG